MKATRRELSAFPCSSGSQLSITRRAEPIRIPSLRPSKALAATHCHKAAATTIQNMDRMANTAPKPINGRSQPRSAKGASHRLAINVNVKEIPASNPKDQVGKPNRSWISARRATMTPTPIASMETKARSARRGKW